MSFLRVRRSFIVVSMMAAAISLLGGLAVPIAVAATGGSQLWASRFTSPGLASDFGRSVAFSPDGKTVFATGFGTTSATDEDYVTVAYDAATGSRRWTARYDGPVSGEDDPRRIVPSPDGTKVFVTGYSDGATGEDYATVAYNATTGAQLWAARYDGSGGEDEAYALAVSPDGSKVFVTGDSAGTTTGADYATVAYRASDGSQLWAGRYNGPGNGQDEGYALTPSPNGSKVFVTGYSAGTTSGLDYATLAYNASTGGVAWTARYNGPLNRNDWAQAIVASPDGSKVFVTGYDPGRQVGQDYSTVAYAASSGAQLWTARYDGPGHESDYGFALAVSPDGARIFVTGVSWSDETDRDAATVAYSTVDGSTSWVARYTGPGHTSDYGWANAVSGSRVYVTGASAGATGLDYSTETYDAATGAMVWAAKYNGPKNKDDTARSVAVNPTGSAVAVTGASVGTSTGQDLATVVYAT